MTTPRLHRHPTPRAIRFGLLLAVAFGLSCAEAELPSVWEGWSRIDLFVDPPQIAEVGGEPARRTEVQPGGHSIDPDGPILQVSGLMQGVLQDTKDRLIKRLTLGPDAAFEFRPMPASANGCECNHQVWIQPLAQPAQLLAEFPAVREDSANAAAVETVDLSAYSNQQVDLILLLDPTGANPKPFGEEEAIWGHATLVQRLPAPIAQPGVPARPNLILIVADTLRADAVGPWRDAPTLTPALDLFASQSDVFLRAYSPFNATNPSFASMLTGRFGRGHGVLDQRTLLPQDLPTVGQLLKDAGYQTYAAVSARHVLALTQSSFQEINGPRNVFSGRLAVDSAMRWIDARAQRGPFFALVHLWDPHTPHFPPQPHAEGYRAAEPSGLGPVKSWVPMGEVGAVEFTSQHGGGGAPSLYEREVSFLDRQVDRFLGYLGGRGLLENSVVAFVSDHGENLTEHISFIGHTGLFETTTHVPLIVHWPGQVEGNELDGLVQSLDLFPTLLEAAGAKPPANDGLSLAPGGAGREGRHHVFSAHANDQGETVRDGRFRLTRHRNITEPPEGLTLFDLRRDIEEQNNLYSPTHESAQQLAWALAEWRRSGDHRSGEQIELDQESLEQLRALGYLD